MPIFGSNFKQNRGATLLEFCIVVTLLITFIISITDITRYLAVKTLLTRGAEAGVLVAQRTGDIDIDLRTVSNPSPEYTKFLEARTKIIQSATEIPLASLVTPSGSAVATRLRSFTNIDTTFDGNTVSTPLDGLLLRPGDQGQIAFSRTPINHPTLCAKGAGCSYGDISDSNGWSEVNNENPFIIRLDATMEMILPIFGTGPIVVEGLAVGKFRSVGSTEFPPSGSIPSGLPAPPVSSASAGSSEASSTYSYPSSSSNSFSSENSSSSSSSSSSVSSSSSSSSARTCCSTFSGHQCISYTCFCALFDRSRGVPRVVRTRLFPSFCTRYTVNMPPNAALIQCNKDCVSLGWEALSASVSGMLTNCGSCRASDCDTSC